MDGATQPKPDWKIGVDIGGTFMDFCALETVSGRVASLKVLTTPDDPGAELLDGLRLLAEREGLDPALVTRFVHGTTVGINTIIQRKGAKLALVTNAGFEDVIELARLRMPDMYSLFCHRPEPIWCLACLCGCAPMGRNSWPLTQNKWRVPRVRPKLQARMA